MENTNYVHLHVHTIYSFLDGFCFPKTLIKRAKELGMKSIAVTDHNHIGASYEMQQEAKKEGLQLILGVETYWTEDINELMRPVEERNKIAAQKAFEAEAITEEELNAVLHNKKIKGIKKIKDTISKYSYDMHGYHLIILAMNQTGWNNLVKLQSEAAVRATYSGRFYVDNSLLEKYNEGLIITTACIASKPSRLIMQKKIDAAEKVVLEWKRIFGDRLYLEIQPLADIRQMVTNGMYLHWVEKHNIQLVSTNDVHYVYKKDHEDHDVLLCIGTNKKVTDTDRLKYVNNFWLRSRKEMEEAFLEQHKLMMKSNIFSEDKAEKVWKLYLQAMDNTIKIAERCNHEIKLGSEVPLLPKIDLGHKLGNKPYLRLLAYQNLYKYAKEENMSEETLSKYEKRLQHELDVVFKRDFEDYMLVVREYATWANSHNVITGPGRGSACGSLLLFLIGITKNIDPIKYNLLFERFLTVDRKGMPDIDLDFLNAGRGKVIEHLEDIYGKDCVCHVGTYSQEGVKSGLKDVARVLDVPFAEINKVTKQLDSITNVPPQPTFKDYDQLKDGSEEDKKQYEAFHVLEKNNEKIFRIARHIEGCKRNFGVHASAVLAMPERVSNYFPVRYDKKSGCIVTLYPGTVIEELGGVKDDILGLKSIDIIVETLKNIDPKLTMNDLYSMVDIKDEKIYKMLSNKQSDCVFQLESDMFKQLLSMIQPESLADIAAITSLGRPGPLSSHMHEEYAAVKNRGAIPKKLLPNIENILGVTNHCLVYQEQLMTIGKKVCGFNSTQSDSLIRKPVAKKKTKMFPMLKRCMIYGKKNEEGPEGWETNEHLPWYDPKKEYGDEISGAVANGYTVEEMESFWNNMIGFASYGFNASHAYAYSYISVLMAWLKYYYPIEFFTAVLSIEEDETKRKKYITVAKEFADITVLPPNINESDINFTFNKEKKIIYYGLSKIKGIGETSYEELIKNKPYTGLEDILNKVPKKVFNKRVAINLIKAGALDSFNPNRLESLKKLYDLRKDKYEDFDTSRYSESMSIEMEKETLGINLTHHTWWEEVKNEQIFSSEEVFILNKTEKTDKRGRLMAFLNLLVDDCTIEAIAFASTYSKYQAAFQSTERQLKLIGKKDNEKIIINKLSIA